MHEINDSLTLDAATLADLEVLSTSTANGPTLLKLVDRTCTRAYGVPISQAIEQSSGREVSIGSVYLTLDRLSNKGLVSSRLGESTRERGGRAKTYFRVTARGLREVRRAQQTLITLWNGVPQLHRGMP
jgi:PadR family transcriptional regulator, regulatory protein PadR